MNLSITGVNSTFLLHFCDLRIKQMDYLRPCRCFYIIGGRCWIFGLKLLMWVMMNLWEHYLSRFISFILRSGILFSLCLLQPLAETNLRFTNDPPPIIRRYINKTTQPFTSVHTCRNTDGAFIHPLRVIQTSFNPIHQQLNSI